MVTVEPTFTLSMISLKGIILKLFMRDKKTATYGFISITSAQKLVNTKGKTMDLSMFNA